MADVNKSLAKKSAHAVSYDRNFISYDQRPPIHYVIDSTNYLSVGFGFILGSQVFLLANVIDTKLCCVLN